jgi:hypothetical protein
MKTAIITLLLSTLYFSPHNHQKEKIDLKFSLKKEKVYGQRTSMVSRTKQVFAANEITYGQNASADTYMELLEAGDSISRYQMWYGDIKMGFDQNGMNQRFASDTASLNMVDPMSRIFSNMIGNKFEATINSFGKIEEIYGLEEMISRAVTNIQSGNSELAEQISSGLGDGGLAKNLEVVTAVMPEEMVRKGDSWTKKQFSSSGLPLIIRNTFTLEEANDQSVRLGVKGDISMDPDHTGAVVGGLDVVYSLTGTRSGFIELERETGWIISAELVDDIDGKIYMLPNNQFPDGTEIPMEMDNTTTVIPISL